MGDKTQNNDTAEALCKHKAATMTKMRPKYDAQDSKKIMDKRSIRPHEIWTPVNPLVHCKAYSVR